MQVILKEKIRNLGSLGECVNVKPGFARNYLIPQGKALMATKTNLAEFEAQRAEFEKQEAERLAKAQSQAEKIEALEIMIEAKAGEGGKLFGSIGTRDIADHISAKGVNVGKHQVRMPEGVIREIGEFDVAIHLHTDVDVTANVKVVAAK
jgi:large subunit ribosomal protein L9